MMHLDYLDFSFGYHQTAAALLGTMYLYGMKHVLWMHGGYMYVSKCLENELNMKYVDLCD